MLVFNEGKRVTQRLLSIGITALHGECWNVEITGSLEAKFIVKGLNFQWFIL